jgi:hypothetical protein
MEETMVIITINGKKLEREFQNMAQALAFVCQNGECYYAKKVELVCTKNDAKKEPEKPVVKPEVNAGNKPLADSVDGSEPVKEAGVDNTAQA